MLETNKILAQLDLTAAAEQNLYTVGVTQNVRIEGITVCNRSSLQSLFRLNFAIAGETTGNKQFIYYDLPISGNNTFMATLVATLIHGDVVRVYSTQGNLSVTLYGQPT